VGLDTHVPARNKIPNNVKCWLLSAFHIWIRNSIIRKTV
jgi:hypothetical protein